MSPNAPAAPPPVIPADVAAFAAENGVTDNVVPLLELTRSLFPAAPIEPLVEEDAEVPDVQWIVMQTDVAGWDADRLFAARQQWTEGLVRLCPAPLLHFFTLGLWASA